MRLDRFISITLSIKMSLASGYIQQGKVKVDDRIITSPGWQVFLDFEKVYLEDKQLKFPQKHVMLMMNKAAGVLTESGLKNPCASPCVTDSLPAEFKKLKPAIYGRLDKDTTGLLLFGTDCSLSAMLLHPGKHMNKTYTFQSQNVIPENADKLLADGLLLNDGIKCLPATLERFEDPHKYRLTINEGMYHQVKRMIGKVGGSVNKLHRESFGNLKLDPTLKPGEVRPLTNDELYIIWKMLPEDRLQNSNWREDVDPNLGIGNRRSKHDNKDRGKDQSKGKNEPDNQENEEKKEKQKAGEGEEKTTEEILEDELGENSGEPVNKRMKHDPENQCLDDKK